MILDVYPYAQKGVHYTAHCTYAHLKPCFGTPVRLHKQSNSVKLDTDCKINKTYIPLKKEVFAARRWNTNSLTVL